MLHDRTDEKAERERLLLDLVRALPSSDYDEQRVLLLAEGSGFYKVVEFFFLQRKNYDKVLAAAVSNVPPGSVKYLTHAGMSVLLS